uniref:Uncharacterized protein n=1 Tax=Macaca nemestrina TaxID=9545 RepID=A0A2K6E0M0_MACNE
MLLGASLCQDRVLVPGSDLLLLTLRGSPVASPVRRRVGSQSVVSQSSRMSDSLPPFRQIPHSWQHVALCLIFKSLGLA